MATGLRIILRLSLLSTYRSGNFYPTANGVLTVGSQPTGSRNRFQPPVSGKPTSQAVAERFINAASSGVWSREITQRETPLVGIATVPIAAWSPL